MAKRNHYEVLGVDKSASNDTIRKAYRAKAKHSHPDKGGSQDEMSALSIAYSILNDSTRRKVYDETGNDKAPSSIESLIRTSMMEALNIGLHESVVNDKEILKTAKDHIVNSIGNMTRELEKAEDTIGKLKAKKTKVKAKKGKEDFFSCLVDRAIEEMEDQKKMIDEKRMIAKKALEQLDDYVEKAGKKELMVNYNTGNSPFLGIQYKYGGQY